MLALVVTHPVLHLANGFVRSGGKTVKFDPVSKSNHVEHSIHSSHGHAAVVVPQRPSEAVYNIA